MFEVRLRGHLGDGPYCQCPGPESNLCLHIWIVILAVGYTTAELLSLGFVGDENTRLHTMLSRTLRGLPPGEDVADDSPQNYQESGNEVSVETGGIGEKDQQEFVQCLRQWKAPLYIGVDWSHATASVGVPFSCEIGKESDPA